MPKKLGTNPKAEAARERKAEKKRDEQDKKEREKEDAKWGDDDKHNASKQNRKENKEQKRLAALQKKHEARALLEDEEAKIKPKLNPASKSQPKVTRAQIAEEKQKQAQLQQKREKEQAKVEETDIFMEENPNRKMAELLAEEGATEARSVEEAIATLNMGETSKVDKNPEKRMKAAYAAFEAERLPILKTENPNLRMSQLKQLLRKEWLKSPDNPMNKIL